MEAHFCSNCGTAIPSGAQFCPKCGTRVLTAVPPQPAVVPPAEPRERIYPVPITATTPTTPIAPARASRTWIWVPIALIGLIIVVWAILAGMPFGEREPQRPAKPQMDVVREREAPSTATLSEVGGPVDQPETAARQRTAAPPVRSSVPPPVASGTVRATEQPRAVPPSRPTVVPPPQHSTTRPEPSSPKRGEIGESEAVARLRAFIGSRSDYGASYDCVTVSSQGYKNQGYTLNARNRCEDSSLGRWRVDSLTREVFRQREDGRFLRP